MLKNLTSTESIHTPWKAGHFHIYRVKNSESSGTLKNHKDSGSEPWALRSITFASVYGKAGRNLPAFVF